MDRPTDDRRPTTNDLTFGKISNGHISARGRPIHFMFGSTVGVSRSALLPVSPHPILKNSNGDISAADHPIYPCLVLGWGSRGRRIEWRYFRFRQIKDGAILKNSNGDISVADHPIYSVFGSRMGFTGSAYRMALFLVWTKFSRYVGKTMREE